MIGCKVCDLGPDKNIVLYRDASGRHNVKAFVDADPFANRQTMSTVNLVSSDTGLFPLLSTR